MAVPWHGRNKRALPATAIAVPGCGHRRLGEHEQAQNAGHKAEGAGACANSRPRAVPYSIAYTATKHAITGLTKSTSLDGRKYHIACGQIDIGDAKTEMTCGWTAGTEQADGSFRSEPRMKVSDVARAVSYMASLPLEANVHFMTIMATAMPYIGRG